MSNFPEDVLKGERKEIETLFLLKPSLFANDGGKEEIR